MEKNMMNLCLIITLLFFSLLGLSQAQGSLVSCLVSNGIHNFSTYSQSTNASNYDQLLNFSIQNLRFTKPTFRKPVTVILPRSQAEISKAIICSRQASLTIRIRCGGHSYEGLSSIAENPFVIIDLMNLNKIKVDLESETAWVEGGSTLGEIYYAISQSSKMHGFPAGSCSTVGSGGHISGGGFGLLSRKFGLAADNVEDALLVNAEGRVMDRARMGEEVFWALRGGGGGSWGVVIAWKIRLVKLPETVTVFVVSRTGTRPEVADLVYKWQSVGPELEDEFYLSAFVGASLPETQTIGISATFKGLFLGPKTAALDSASRVFPELKLVAGDCREMSWIESVVFFSGLKTGSTAAELKDRFLHDKGFFKAKADYVRTTVPLGGIKGALEILEKEPKGYVILDPYGGKMGRIRSHELPFPHRSGNLFAIQYLVSWNEEDNWRSEGFMDWIAGFYDYMTPFVSKGPRAAYVNYIDLDLGILGFLNGSGKPTAVARSWGEKYFLGNYDRLVRAKRECDPDNVFSHPQSLPPLEDLNEV